MRPTAFIVFWAVAALATPPVTGAAQTIPSAYRFIETAQEGGAFVGLLSTDRGRFGFAPGSGTVAGVRYGIEIGGPFSFEAVARYLMGSRDVIDPERPEGSRKAGEADAGIAMIDGRLKFSFLGRRLWNGFGPYFVAGGGVAVDAAGEQPEDERILADDRFEFGTSFLGVLGLGARWLPSDRLVFRTDLTFNLWQVETPRGYRTVERDLDAPEDEWLRALGITFGAALRF